MLELFQGMREELQHGRPVVLCSVINSFGSTPRSSGAKMAVLQDGRVLGTIGGGAVEYQATLLAKGMGPGDGAFEKFFSLTPGQLADIGMICGGDVKLYFQYIYGGGGETLRLLDAVIAALSGNTPAWLITEIRHDTQLNMGLLHDETGLHFLKNVPLAQAQQWATSRGALVEGAETYFIEPLVQKGMTYIFGGGHVAQELVPVLANTDFRTVIFEDREAFAKEELFRGVSRCVLGDFSDIEECITIQPEDHVVIVTRGHLQDLMVLKQVLKTPANYIGMMGSRSKIAAIHGFLTDAGFDETDIARIHNPIGLPILAQTPAEIAISIAAELIRHRANERKKQQ